MEPVSEHEEHHSLLSAFVRACNSELERRGFECAEVWVMASLIGEAIMHRAFPTTGKKKNGEVVVISLQVRLPLPWLNDELVEAAEIVSGALAQSELTSLQICSQHRILRVPFARYLESRSSIVEQSNGRQHDRLRIATD